MYENNYPNDFGTSRTGSSTNTNSYQAGGSSNTYYYGNGSATPNTQPPQKEKKGSGAGKKIVLGICCGLLFGIFAGLGFAAVTTATDVLKEELGLEEKLLSEEEGEAVMPEETKEAISNTVSAQVTKTEIATTTVTDVTEVVKAVMPSVVSVNNKYVETTSFWGQEYSSEAVSTGSGIIVGQNDTELLLVTNYHVIASAEELTVQFCDGEQAQAQTKGSDSDKDLAVIAVQLEDIEDETMEAIAISTLGDSNALTVGEPVIAIGNALGYGQSVTTGVVSALNRAIMMENGYESGNYGYFEDNSTGDKEINTFIQTDAAINPGNSGGALLNIKGEVIGINSNKIGGSAVEGMGYAIPISDAQPIIEDLMSKETRLKVDEEDKGYLGITGVDVVDEYSEIYGMPKGVYVSSVSEGTGAYEAGLIKGDIITALNGEEVESMDDLKNELSYYSAGETVELTIMQGSPTGYQAKNVSVTLGEVPKAQ